MTPPTISRTGQVLTCNPGDWTGNPTFSYRWLLNGTAVVGATAATWSPPESAWGALFGCEVVGTNAAGSSLPALAQEVFIGILDAFDATTLTLASLHKMMAAQTGARVRRTIGDPLAQDAVIPFTASGAFDEAALLAHASSGDAFFVSALDPAGRGFPAEQLTAATQPRIVLNGVIERDGGPLPSMFFSQAKSLRSVLRPDRTAYPNITVIMVYRASNLTDPCALWGADDGGYDRAQILAGVFQIQNGNTGIGQPALNTTNRVVYAASLRVGVTNGSFVMVNGVAGTPFTEAVGGTHNTLGIGAINGDNAYPMVGSIEAFAMIEGALTAAQLQSIQRNLGARNSVTVT